MLEYDRAPAWKLYKRRHGPNNSKMGQQRNIIKGGILGDYNDGEMPCEPMG